MQDVRRKPPIKYNKDGSISLDGSGVKILRLLEPQGEPDVIECDGMRYVPERTCRADYPYEQLSQVICDMWYWIRKSAYAEQGYLTISELKNYAQKLRELGVIVDE